MTTGRTPSPGRTAARPEPIGADGQSGTTITAILITRYRPQELGIVLDRLADLAVDEVILVENGPTGAANAVGAEARGVTVIRSPENLGVAARNLAADQPIGELLLMLDDDAYPTRGAVETLVAAFDADQSLAAAGGFVRDVDERGAVLRDRQPGTFDWFLRGARSGPAPAEGVPAVFFPEGASMLRTSAFQEVGGFFAPFFFGSMGLELSTRLLARGWDVRYFPDAQFDHLKSPADRASPESMLYARIRNHLWYLWLHFPASLAARRMAAYLAFDLVEAIYRRAPGAWVRAIRDAWGLRDSVRGARAPLPREALRRAELNRGRMHARLLGAQLARRIRRRNAAS
jgi:GT2 family glycosyltransferase